MVEWQATVEFRKRREDNRTQGIAEDIDGNDEGGELFIRRVEFFHYLWHARGEH